MSIIKKTDSEKLLNRLRGEVGEIIESWIVLNIYDYNASKLQTPNIESDMANESLNIINLVRSKFRDDIISRLVELSQSKHGRLNFHYAADKFKTQKKEVIDYREFLKSKHLVNRRNWNIAHKKISPTWNQIDPKPHVPKSVLLRSVVKTIIIMKGFDRRVFGNEYKELWMVERKERYNFQMSAEAKYILLPYKANLK